MASIVVVGGGIAGLACAWRLARSGYDVEVLEREAVPGGRMRSEEVDGYRLDRGAVFLDSGQQSLRSMAQMLGLEDRIRWLEDVPDAVVREGRIEPIDPGTPRSLLKSRVVSARAKLRLMRLPLELSRYANVLDPMHPEDARALDGEKASVYLERIVGAEARDRLLLPHLSAATGLDLGNASAAAFLFALQAMLRDPQVGFMQGGLGRMTAALAEQTSIRLGCSVTSIESEDGGVRVHYRVGPRSGMAVADAAVVALPGSRVGEHCPGLTPAERGFFEHVGYSRGMLAQILLEKAPLVRGRRLAFPTALGGGIRSLTFAHCRRGEVSPGAGLLAADLDDPAVRELWRASDAEVEAFVLRSLERSPVGSLSPTRVVVHRWPEALPRFRPGYLGVLREFKTRADRSPRLAFCGDYLLGPSADAALASGLRAASEVAQILASS